MYSSTYKESSIALSDHTHVRRESFVNIDNYETDIYTMGGKDNGLSEVTVTVLIRTCYEQWGKWRNYHLFRLFSIFCKDARVKFYVEIILPKMALEISIDGQLVYSRLMKTSYDANSTLTDLVVGQINRALSRDKLEFIPAAEYNNFLAQFRRRMSNSMGQSDIIPGDDDPQQTNTCTVGGGTSLLDKGTQQSLQGKGKKF